MSAIEPEESDDYARPNREIWTVSRLNYETKDLLEGEFASVWIEGEISNLARPASGHLYFSLKDEQCQVRAAMFKNRNRFLDFAPENGTQVLLRARVSLYPNRGEFQLVVESMEESGEGALRRAFEALKKQLHAQGLFAQTHKREPPKLPRQIGVITSPTGAALRDILSVLERRFPSIPVIVYPVPVQGQGAGDTIAQMIATAGRRAECDVLLLARGGGSLEDLWAFNEEALARAIFDSAIPIVTGIGHEIDFTIADFVADRRAPTPSAAAELITPDRDELLQRFRGISKRLQQLIDSDIARRRERVAWVKSRLIHPRRHLENLAQRADETAARLERALAARMTTLGAELARLHAELRRHEPGLLLEMHRQHSAQLRARLSVAARNQLAERRTRLNDLRRTFLAVSPQQTLDRGYAIVSRRADGRILRHSREIKQGEGIVARLAEGELQATVDKT